MNRHEKRSQKLFKRQLINRCDVFTKKRVRNNGNWEELYVRTSEQVPCRMSTNRASNSETISEVQQKFFSPFTLYSLPMTLKSDDRVLLYVKRGDEWTPERFYETKNEPINPSFLDHHYETACENMVTHYKIEEMTVPMPNGETTTMYYLGAQT